MPDETKSSEIAISSEARPLQQHRQRLLQQLANMGLLCLEGEAQLPGCCVPEIESLLKLHRMLILRLSMEAEQTPDRLRLIRDLMRTVLDWERLEYLRKEREAAAKNGVAPQTLADMDHNTGAS